MSTYETIRLFNTILNLYYNEELTQSRIAKRLGLSTAKVNRQLPEDAPEAKEVGALVTQALNAHPMFVSAALPHTIFPPLFNRYEGGEHFGVDILGPGLSCEIVLEQIGPVQRAQAEGRNAGDCGDRARGIALMSGLLYFLWRLTVFILNFRA